MKNIKKILSKNQKIGFLFLTLIMILNACLEIISLNFIFLNISYFTTENFSISDHKIIKSFEFFISNDLPKFLILGLIVSFSLKTISQIFFYWFQSKYIAWLRADLSEFYFTGYLKLPRLFYLRSNVSELIKNITSEVEYFSAAIFSISTVLMEIFILIFISIFLLTTNLKISFITIFILLIYSLLIYFFNAKYVNNLGKQRSREINERFKIIIEFLSGNKIIKLLDIDDNLIKKFKFHNNKLANIYQQTTFRNSLPKPLFEILFVALITVFLLSLYKNQLEIQNIFPILGTFIAAGYRLIPSFGRIISQLQIYKFLIPSSQKLFTDKSKFIIPFKDEKKNNFKFFEKKILLDKVTFSYHKNDKDEKNIILDNVLLNINVGEKIGIVGKSGSGKSTVLDLIMGLIKPTIGEVTIDGNNLNNIERKWQSLIGCIPQDVFIADTSLRKNIAFGIEDKDIDDNKINMSLKIANLSSFVDNLKFGLNTILGQNGARTSGGQKQRIGIARAFYHNPEILILDEATSSLDPSTENQIIDEIYSRFKNKTIIMVSHKKENLKYCETIYEIDKKKLIKI